MSDPAEKNSAVAVVIADAWRRAALLKDRTRRAIRERVRAGEDAVGVAHDFNVPLQFVTILASEQLFEDTSELAPQEPSADTIAAVRALYRDDLDAMADAILRLRADLDKATRGDVEPSRCVWAKTPSGLHAPSCLGGERVNYAQSEMTQWSACHYCGRPIQTATPPTCGYCGQAYGFDFQERRVICGCTSTTNQET